MSLPRRSKPRSVPRLRAVALGWRPSLRVAVGVLTVAVVVGMALAVSQIVGVRLRATAADAALSSAHGVVRGFIDPILTEESLALDAEREPAVDEQLERLVSGGELERINIWSRDGTIVYSNDPRMRGVRASIDARVARTFAGESLAFFSRDVGRTDGGSGDVPALDVRLALFVPVWGGIDGDPIGVYEVHEDASQSEASLAAAHNEIFVIALMASATLVLLLWLAFAGASRLLARQNRLLVERARRDPLTGLPNHGHLLSSVEDAMARARSEGALAIVDVDNFKLLNDSHGYQAGDEALRAVAAALSAVARPDQLFGRFGPDEFVIADMRGAERLTATLHDLTRALERRSLRFRDSESLPVTVSSGLATAPRDGDRALDLIGVAEVALAEARTGGGQTLKIADNSTVESLAAQNSTFGVLEGLLAIVDAKDHYTKFHAEDVTTYALLLARALGLDEDTKRVLRLASLLHDVGKVGIPDAILRKPGALDAQERGVMTQHVALGDAILSAVPQLATVRDGVRHHHERWDGQGYLHGLRGTEIPLVARIIAVADAYSAMTTTRPYRKALGRREALKRISQAAGSQLDPELARQFVALMRGLPASAPVAAHADHAIPAHRLSPART